MSGWDRFVGLIAAGGFEGHAVVVGCWRSSPLGQIVDVMWVDPSGCRTLLAPRPDVAERIAGMYDFDEVMVTEVRGGWDGERIDVTAGPLHVQLDAGPRDWRSWVFATRPRVLREQPWWVAVEDAVARPLVGRFIGGAEGVRAAGVAPGGMRECYAAADWRRVRSGALRVASWRSRVLGNLPGDLGVGLSSFPRRPAVTHCTTLVERLPA